jgi:hypothetical protein
MTQAESLSPLIRPPYQRFSPAPQRFFASNSPRNRAKHWFQTKWSLGQASEGQPAHQQRIRERESSEDANKDAAQPAVAELYVGHLIASF